MNILLKNGGFLRFLCAKQFFHGRIIPVMIKQRGINHDKKRLTSFPNRKSS